MKKSEAAAAQARWAEHDTSNWVVVEKYLSDALAVRAALIEAGKKCIYAEDMHENRTARNNMRKLLLYLGEIDY